MQSPTTTLKREDLLWLLAYPLYQIIGTIRHEASHALLAWLLPEVDPVHKVTIIPRGRALGDGQRRRARTTVACPDLGRDAARARRGGRRP